MLWSTSLTVVSSASAKGTPVLTTGGGALRHAGVTSARQVISLTKETGKACISTMLLSRGGRFLVQFFQMGKLRQRAIK